MKNRKKMTIKMNGIQGKILITSCTLLLLAIILLVSPTKVPATASALSADRIKVHAKETQDPAYGGVMYNGHKYLLIIEGKIWSDAKADCETKGGHLVTITSIGENDFVTSLLEDMYISWIGFTDELNEGSWQWVTGEEVTYSNWDSGEPNEAANGEDYAELLNSGFWNDIHDEPHAYVCEWDGEDGSGGLPSDYVLYLPMDEGTDNTVHDQSSNGNDGLITGATWTTGISGNALHFDGEAYIKVPNHASLNPTSEITLMAWIYADNWNGNPRILQKGQNDNQYALTATNDDGQNVLDLWLVGLDNGGQITLPSMNTWHHVAGTYDGLTTKMYVDGELLDSRQASGSIRTSTHNLYIGTKEHVEVDALDSFKGVIDEVAIYDRGLSAEEIAGCADSSSHKPLTSHNPIFINGNDDFINQATVEGWSGDGSETDPIIIDNLKIAHYYPTIGNDLINIRNTDLHYQISNCFLDGLGGGQGISLNDASNGRVYKNTMVNAEGFGIYVEQSSNTIVAQNTLSNTGGISLWESSGNTVTGNTVYSDSGPAGGIGLDNSHDNVVESNFIYASGGGIGLGGSDNNIISSNKIVGDGSNGGIIISASKSNTVSNNTAYGCFAGIYVQGASNNVVSGNLVSHNTFSGILVEQISGEFTAADSNIIDSNTAFFNNEGGIVIAGPANSNNVTNNLVHTNQGGIRVEGSDNVIIGNDLYDNNPGGSQAVDDGTSNVFADNYWNDWTSPGLPYAIDGAANNQDPSPRVVPSFDTHQLLSLILLYPLSGMTFSGTVNVNIQWTYARDLQGHAVTYSVYYSPDNGESWILLASDLITSSYEWDTTQVLNGNYKIKVIASCSEGLSVEDSSSGTFSIDQSYNEPAPDVDIIQLLFNLLSLVLTVAVLLVIFAIGVVFFYFACRVLGGILVAITSRIGSKTQVIYHATSAASGRCDFCGTKIKEGDYFCPYCYRRIARMGGRRIMRRVT
ncbi:MAG: NosD domain-containing protein [Candidatus Odinarchaeota archaeon]